MGDFTQLSNEQLEVVHKIYTHIGEEPFKMVDHMELFDHRFLIGLRIKGAIKKYKKKGKARGNTWIITTSGVASAKRYERCFK